MESVDEDILKDIISFAKFFWNIFDGGFLGLNNRDLVGLWTHMVKCANLPYLLVLFFRSLRQAFFGRFTGIRRVADLPEN